MKANLVARLAFFLAVIVAWGCTNDYDQFDFEGAGGEGGEMPADATAERDAGADQGDTSSGRPDIGPDVAEASSPPPDVSLRDVVGDEASPFDSVAEVVAEAEAGRDAGRDVTVDTGSDAVDAIVDVSPEVRLDGGREADAVIDTRPDVSLDGGIEGGIDAPDDTSDQASPVFPDVEVPDVSLDSEPPIDASVVDAPDVSLGSPSDAPGDVPPEAACAPGTKSCAGACVSTSDPDNGCANALCTPCALAHATAACGDSGGCEIGACDQNFADCDGVASNGCEVSLMTDIDHCGDCRRPCSAGNVLSRQCAAGVCAPTCALGFADCASPPAPMMDDGCEHAPSSTGCGSCANDCTAQGPTVGSGLSCLPSNQCGCISNLSCGGITDSCDLTGLCVCNAQTCRPGESCGTSDAGADLCTCNGSTACTAGQTCCRAPMGCRDLGADPQNCGACGRQCPTGFACVAGSCQCDADSDCRLGSSGSCTVGGQCMCRAFICNPGQRCQANGTCG